MKQIIIDNKTYLIDSTKALKEELKKVFDGLEIYLLSEEDYFDKMTKFTIQEIIDPTNDKHLICALIDVNDSNYHTAKKQLTLTGNHQWRDTIADEIKELLDKHQDKKFIYIDDYEAQQITEYNKQVSWYNLYHNLDQITVYQDKEDKKIKTDIKIGI